MVYAHSASLRALPQIMSALKESPGRPESAQIWHQQEGIQAPAFACGLNTRRGTRRRRALPLAEQSRRVALRRVLRSLVSADPGLGFRNSPFCNSEVPTHPSPASRRKRGPRQEARSGFPDEDPFLFDKGRRFRRSRKQHEGGAKLGSLQNPQMCQSFRCLGKAKSSLRVRGLARGKPRRGKDAGKTYGDA